MNNDLTEAQKKVLQEKATEAPFTGHLLNEKRNGMFACVGCGTELFSSETKFDSGSGWPSFYEAMPGTVTFVEDSSHGMERTEAVCSKCGGHLGHVFNDAYDKPGGKRFCINSCILDFKEK